MGYGKGIELSANLLVISTEKCFISESTVSKVMVTELKLIKLTKANVAKNRFKSKGK